MTVLANVRVSGRLARCFAAFAAVLTLVGPVLQARAATAPAPAAAAANDPEQYRIGPGDVLHINVYQSPDLSIDARVTETGVISYPLLGSVKLGGLTVSQAESHLVDALKKGEIVKAPQVNIIVTTVRANQVNVLGQVGHPGRFPLDLAGMRLTEVLALAGGVMTGGSTGGGGSDTVVVIGQHDGRPYRHEVDLPKIFAAGGTAEDIVVQPGDTVWVDRAPQIYIYGEIQHPGALPLLRGMTVMQAVAAGGGATPRGTLKGLRVSRRGVDGKIQTTEPAMDETLKDGDVMYIRESLF